MRMSLILLSTVLAVYLLAGVSDTQAEPDIEVVPSDEIPRPDNDAYRFRRPGEEGPKPGIEHHPVPGSDGSLPFSDAVSVGNLIFTSGKLGIPPGSRSLVDGGIGPETRQTLENIQATLERLDSSMDKVAKCTVFLADMAEWPAMNEVYKTYFPNPPARSAVAVAGLALDAQVEIECIAAR